MDGIQPLYEVFGTICGITGGGGFSVASWGVVPFELSLTSFVAVSIAKMRLMGLWEMLLRAALAKNGRGMKMGVILMALVDALVDAPAVPVGNLTAASL